MASKVPLPPPPKEELRNFYQDDEMSMSEIALLYGVSIATVHKWIHGYGIEPRVRVNGNSRGLYKEINGVRHKRCAGLNHVGEAYLPFDYFYTRKSGNPRSCCIRCEGLDGRRVEFSAYYKGWTKSIVNRLGVMEACRRLEISDTTYRKWKKKPPKTILRRHARSIVHLMRELRHTGEVRHKHSIRRGSAVRGETERPVQRQSDLYTKSGGDAENEYRRRRRRDPEIRQRENELLKASHARRRERLTDGA